MRNDRPALSARSRRTRSAHRLTACACAVLFVAGAVARLRAGRPVADVLRLVQLASLLAAETDHHRQRREAAAGLGLSAARHGIGRVDAGGRQRRHVRDVRTDDGGGAGSQERQVAVGMDAPDCAERAEPRLPARQPRRRRARQHGLRRHARRLPLRARRARGDRALVGARRREPDRTFDYRRAARRRRQGHRRHQRRRGRHPRVPRRLRCEDRQAGVALLHHPVTGRARAARDGRATAGCTAAARPG